MTKLLDADKLLERLYILDGIWSDDDNVPFVLGNVMSYIKSGIFDAAAELQPEEPRQTLVETLKDAPVGTRFWHAVSVLKGKNAPLVIGDGKMYFDGRVTEIVEHYKYHNFYADEFIIERPTY